jgi:hypothetical protein
MVLDGALTDAEVIGDVLARVAFKDHLENLTLPWR